MHKYIYQKMCKTFNTNQISHVRLGNQIDILTARNVDSKASRKS